jgi:hypothetical protein
MAGLTEKHALILLGDLLTLPPSKQAMQWKVVAVEKETLTIHVEPVEARAALGTGPWAITVRPTVIPAKARRDLD